MQNYSFLASTTNPNGVKTNATPFDYSLLAPGFKNEVWNPSGQQVEATPDQNAAFMDDDGTSYPSSTVLWPDAEGATCETVIDVPSKSSLKTGAAAFKDLAAHAFYSITQDYILLRDPDTAGGNNRVGYLFPSYTGGLILAGQEVGTKVANAQRYLVPILRGGSEITQNVKYYPGEPLIDDLDAWGKIAEAYNKGASNMSPTEYERLTDRYWHAFHAWGKYCVVRAFAIDRICIRLINGPKTWAYVRYMLKELGIVAGNPELNRKRTGDAVRAKLIERNNYVDSKNDPDIAKKPVEKKVYVWGTEEPFNMNVLKTLSPHTIIFLYADPYSTSHLNKGQRRFWPADEADQIALLSLLNDPKIERPAIEIVH